MSPYLQSLEWDGFWVRFGAVLTMIVTLLCFTFGGFLVSPSGGSYYSGDFSLVLVVFGGSSVGGLWYALVVDRGGLCGCGFFCFSLCFSFLCFSPLLRVPVAVPARLFLGNPYLLRASLGRVCSWTGYGVMEGLKTVSGLVARVCILLCGWGCNRLGSGGPCELLRLLCLVPPP